LSLVWNEGIGSSLEAFAYRKAPPVAAGAGRAKTPTLSHLPQ
jgi:hypothetical protein